MNDLILAAAATGEGGGIVGFIGKFIATGLAIFTIYILLKAIKEWGRTSKFPTMAFLGGILIAAIGLTLWEDPMTLIQPFVDLIKGFAGALGEEVNS